MSSLYQNYFNFQNIYALSNFLGILGVILVVWAYFASLYDLWKVHDLSYLLFNFFGSWLLIISLIYHWNAASFMIEIVWLAITSFGIFKYFFIKPKNP